MYETEDDIKQAICTMAFHPDLTADKYKCIGDRCPMLREGDMIVNRQKVDYVYCGNGGKPQNYGNQRASKPLETEQEPEAPLH